MIEFIKAISLAILLILGLLIVNTFVVDFLSELTLQYINIFGFE